MKIDVYIFDAYGPSFGADCYTFLEDACEQNNIIVEIFEVESKWNLR